MILKDKKRFIKFALVGASGTVVDFIFLNLLTEIFGFSNIFSSIISFLIAVINNFIWNRLWTYPESKEMPLSGQLLKFFIVSLMGLIIRTPLFALIIGPLEKFGARIGGSIPFLDPELIGRNLSLLIVIVIVLFWNYFINKFWTYKDIK